MSVLGDWECRNVLAMSPRRQGSLLAVSAAGAACAVVSLVILPFYGLLEPNNRSWPFDVLGTRTAVDFALSQWPSRFMLPGSQSFGYLSVAIAGLVGLFALAASIASFRRTWFARFGGGAVAVISTALPVLMVMEMFARPPFGVGPPLQYSWGAVVGVTGSFVCAIAAWASFGSFITHRRQAAVSYPSAKCRYAGNP